MPIDPRRYGEVRPMSIWKYKICSVEDTPGLHSFEVPIGSVLVFVERQGNDVCAWYEVFEEGRGNSAKTFAVLYTGQRPIANSSHVKTLVFHASGIVLHIYEVI